ncbi:MAG: hypothetical protein CMF17_08590 [Idiomarinaceae bacterium]|nr:hypothetical protein [Idiomarinaceae bacterium]
MRSSIFALLVCAAAVSGCQMNGEQSQYDSPVKKTGTKRQKFCYYDRIKADEYRLDAKYSYFVESDFFYDPNSPAFSQKESDKFEPIRQQKFKVEQTGLITFDAESLRKPKHKIDRYKEIKINNNYYRLDKAYATKVITEDCSEFYISVSDVQSVISGNVREMSGDLISDNELLSFIGSKPLQKRQIDADVVYDEFDKIYKIRTPEHNNMILRAVYDERDDRVVLIQLYADLVFFGEWGNISRAVDDSGNERTLVRIDTDTDCSASSVVGFCNLTETVGAEFPESFLRKNKDGFRVKFAGSIERVRSIEPFMIESLLKAVERLQSSE